MNRIRRFPCFLILLFALPAFSQIRLPNIVRDSMVLQRNAALNIWGWASPGEKVNIRFNGSHAIAVTDAHGKWICRLPPIKAGGPYTMELKGKNSIVLKDILIGDVWLCAGQSNMVHQMKVHNVTYAADIANADFKKIRQYWVPTATSLSGPLDNLPPGYWKSATQNDINDFSAVAFFFAKQIYLKYRIPIGIINASVGGTAIESWTSERGLADFQSLSEVIKRNKDTAYVNDVNRKAMLSQKGRASTGADKGLEKSVKWYDTSYVAKNWRSINIPGYWEDQGIKDLDGVVWYRKTIDVPASMTGIPARIHMGRIIDADRLYVNGIQVGSTGYQYPQRRYNLMAGILKPGKNTIVIRVENSGGKGGFVPDKPYFMEVGKQSIDLKGEWFYKVGQVYLPVFGRGPSGITEQAQPTALYNSMIAPLANYGLKGILWYQGESNVGNAKEYKKLLPSIIKDWRNTFSTPDLPFLYVQLPNYGDMRYLPSESGSALVREAALETLKLPSTGMAVTIDLGEWNDIHPDNKKDVGERLALVARHSVYGEKNLIYSGPLFRSAKIENNKIVLSFDHVGGGLIAVDGEPLSSFEIASEDKKFVWAEATIEGDKVLVWSPQVSNPKFVRYAWADSPVGPNLYNLEKLPASPFRTDK